ncbi:NAD-dependent epimerase/dehydratase family protein [Rhodoferax ferrireducens]|uniref:NAD-dependent epimerase/dehydratase family protein n=1 Tax=Rhodoferax ferrireducens TaxID=192843 RepID=UPI000E0DA21C|nr:NAD(P)-dependent oxidoreductase [Rhodoferax ferrireducens]
MRVLLTGASGFLGRYVLDHLRRQGVDTVMLGRTRAPDSAFADFIEADILASPDLATLTQASGATHLLHLAWYAEHGQYWTSPLNLRWVDATIRLVEAFCQTGGQQVVVAGTCAEYDWSYGYCREDCTPLNPATLYGTAKDAARRLVMAVCAQYHVPCAWGRVFLPFGNGEASPRLIPSLIDVFRGKRPPFGINAFAYRDFLHASDVAEGLLTLLRRGAHGAYNISSGQPVQLADVVRDLARLLDADPQAVLGLTTERPDEPLLLVGESRKLQSLDWQPAMSLVQGWERTVREVQP